MLESDKPVVAAFDFDGTLTCRDTLFPFLLHLTGPTRFFLNILALVPTLTVYGLGMIRNDLAKERVLKRFLGGKQIDSVKSGAVRFAKARLPGLIRDEAMKRLEWHKKQGHQCILVSASLDIYLQPWATQAGFDHVISSSLETLDDGCITGKLSGANCYGIEKVRGLERLLGNRNRYTLFAYGDSRGDRELLSAADYAYFREMPSQ